MSVDAKLAMALICSALAAGCAQQQAQAPPPPPVANTPGPYDGSWEVDAAAAGSGTSTSDISACEAVRLMFEVKNNQVEGMLGRSPYGGGRVTQSGPGTTPVSGTVQPDGTLNASWQSYTATGKLTADNKAELRWRGTCGPRVATGGRVTSTEGAGSSGTR